MKAYDLRYLMTDGVLEVEGDLNDKDGYFHRTSKGHGSNFIPPSRYALSPEERCEKVLKILNGNKKSTMKKLERIYIMIAMYEYLYRQPSEYENREKS